MDGGQRRSVLFRPIRLLTLWLVGFCKQALGPGTGDLKARVGLHSGQVTAGVLRGAKARFQLFGDTVNTAARMQTSGLLNKIHISEETTEHLRQANKHHWVYVTRIIELKHRRSPFSLPLLILYSWPKGSRGQIWCNWKGRVRHDVTLPDSFLKCHFMSSHAFFNRRAPNILGRTQ